MWRFSDVSGTDSTPHLWLHPHKTFKIRIVRSLKAWKTFTSWHACLPTNILLYYNVSRYELENAPSADNTASFDGHPRLRWKRVELY
jgi:hypothetical protein